MGDARVYRSLATAADGSSALSVDVAGDVGTPILARALIILDVLSFEVHRELAELIGAVHRVTVAASDRAPAAEVELRVNAAFAIAGRLETMIGGDFYGLKRHLSWLRKRHLEGRPATADSDIADLRERDLVAVIEAVEQWSTRLLEPGLVAAISCSWQAQRYDAAVREAFVYTEAQIRQLAEIDPSSGLTGRKLISRLLQGNGPSDRWSAEGFLGHLKEGEQTGARDLLNGAVSLFRNATAHRETAYRREEAEDVLHLVNLCLRLLAKYRGPDIIRAKSND